MSRRGRCFPTATNALLAYELDKGVDVRHIRAAIEEKKGAKQ